MWGRHEIWSDPMFQSERHWIVVIATIPATLHRLSSNWSIHSRFLTVCPWKVTETLTLPKFNIAPENRPSQKETSLPTIIFQLRGGKRIRRILFQSHHLFVGLELAVEDFWGVASNEWRLWYASNRFWCQLCITMKRCRASFKHLQFDTSEIPHITFCK